MTRESREFEVREAPMLATHPPMRSINSSFLSLASSGRMCRYELV